MWSEQGVRFDDRLATVLSQPVGTPHDRAVRWRQLVDLVARSGGQADRALLGQAIDVIRSERSAISEPIRAASARSIAGSPIPLALLTVFAADELAVAAPLIASASLSGQTLSDLRVVASPDVRRFLDSLDGQPEEAQAEGPPKPEVEQEAEPAGEPAAAVELAAVPTISDVLAHIERLQSFRGEFVRPAETTIDVEQPDLLPDAVPVPPLPAPTVTPAWQARRGSPSFAAAVDPPQFAPDGPVPALFRWECSAGGDIEWVDGAPRGPLIGRSIAVAEAGAGVDDTVGRAFGLRAPFRDCRLALGDDGLMAGEWRISGAPAFAPGDGRFIGYRGIARRGETEDELASRPADGATSSGHEALREMIHEIRTPLNAIIGFAEVIDGQYFGPAHRRYRQRAADILTNARSLLGATEDLDFVARLKLARGESGDQTDFATFLPPLIDALQKRAIARGVDLRLDVTDVHGRSPIDAELAERLLSRFADAVLAASAAGETLTLRLRRVGDRFSVGLTRPGATIHAGKDELLDPEFTVGGGDRALLGLGFSLRLINGLVVLVGGALDIDAEYFTLSLPLRQ